MRRYNYFKATPLKLSHHEKHGTTSDKIGLFVNGILAILTIFAIFLAYQANQTSQAALKYAINKDSLDDIKQYKKALIDSIERDKNQKHIESSLNIARQNATASNSLAAVASKSFHTQTETLLENQKQFERQNESYLQINDFHVDSLWPFEPILASWKIENFGKNPAKLIEFSSVTNLRFNIPPLDVLEAHTAARGSKLNTYFRQDHPIEYIYQDLFSTRISPLDYDNIMNSRVFIYAYGEIIYENLVTKKRWKYRFLIKYHYEIIDGSHRKYWPEYIINENIAFG